MRYHRSTQHATVQKNTYYVLHIRRTVHEASALALGWRARTNNPHRGHFGVGSIKLLGSCQEVASAPETPPSHWALGGPPNPFPRHYPCPCPCPCTIGSTCTQGRNYMRRSQPLPWIGGLAPVGGRCMERCEKAIPLSLARRFRVQRNVLFLCRCMWLAKTPTYRSMKPLLEPILNALPPGIESPANSPLDPPTVEARSPPTIKFSTVETHCVSGVATPTPKMYLAAWDR